MAVIGFDFGTTNSLISLVRGNRAINYLDEEERPIPSVVSYEGSKTIVGRKAKERLARAGLGVQGNTVRSPKMYLGRDGVFVDGVERSPVDIVADVVRHVLDQSKTGRRGRDLHEVSGAVVTIPVDMQGYRRRALRDAFRVAGLNIVQFVHEPLAAMYGLFRSSDLGEMLRRYDRKLVLVFDWGGGTLDLTLCRLAGTTAFQIANDGTDEVGGDIFDELLMNRLLKNACESRKLSTAPELQLGARERLLHECERAKIDLSSRSSAAVYVSNCFRGVEDEDFDYKLAQEELESIVTPLLDAGFKRIAKILEDSGLAPEQVALCVATGGMANMPAVERRLHEWFGVDRVEIPDGTATLIAEGAGWIAHDGAGLRLAKSVDLTLARNSHLPLVKAGTAMPREGEVQRDTFHLYCVDPRDGVAKFQIGSPRTVGGPAMPSEPRTTLENLTIKVDSKARAFRERLELDVIINDDLILEVRARSLNARDEDARQIHSLEFGLAFPSAATSGQDNGGAQSGWTPAASGGTDGSILTVRPNVADRIDRALVPGEYLYQFAPGYFDTRGNPPAEQVHERLYYQPCAGCGRRSNDPACTCGPTVHGASRGATRSASSGA